MPLFQRLDMPLPAEPAGRLVAGDLDADGDVDLVADKGGVFLNDGHGRFDPHPQPSPAVQSAIWGEGAVGIVCEDFTGDGAADLLLDAGGYGSPILRFWSNDGTGVLSVSGSALPALSWTRMRAMAAADFDGDGDRDVIAGGFQMGGAVHSLWPVQPVMLLNDGSGNFLSSPARLPGVAVAASDVSLRDFDGDGDVDILFYQRAASSQSQQPLRLFANNGSGWFLNVPLPASPPGAFEFMAVGAPMAASVPAALYGSFTGIWMVSFPPGGPITAATLGALPGSGVPTDLGLFLDVDADGDDEWIPRMPTGITTFAWTAGGGFAQVLQTLPTPSPYWPGRITGGDLDGDGDRDLVFSGLGCAEFLVNTGQGVLVSAGSSFAPAAAVWTQALGDVDGDGLTDLAWYVGGPAWARGDGRGGWAIQPPATGGTTLAPGGLIGLFFQDLDVDRDLYRASIILAGDSDAWFRNDAAAGWTLMAAWPASEPASCVLTGDLDADGDEDVVTIRRGGNVWITRNLGPSGLAGPVVVGGISPLNSDGALADLDVDGDLDIVVASPGGCGSVRLMNDGSGTFTVSPMCLPAAEAVVAGDLDGDWDPDLVLGAAVAATVLRNDLGGVFTPMGALGLAPCSAQRLRLIDADDDGDLDVVSGPCGVRLHRNDGTGGFAAPENAAATTRGDPMLAGDVDLDGDLDLVLSASSGGGAHVFRNTTRQTAVAGIPLIGHPLRVDVHGPPGTIARLFASPAAALIPAPPFGTLQLDPWQALQIDVGPVTTAGYRRSAFAIPASPALAGIPFLLQGWLEGPSRLTNAVALSLIDG